MNHNNKNRSWIILCWNVRGINSEDKWEAIKSKIWEAKCDIASKKPREISLIHNTSETSALGILIFLIFFPLMGPLVDALSCGIAPSSLTIQYSRIAMLCRLNFSASSLEKTGFSLIFMLLVHQGK